MASENELTIHELQPIWKKVGKVLQVDVLGSQFSQNVLTTEFLILQM